MGEDFLPEVSTIQRPEELLKRPPYWMVVRQESRTRVTVNGSHAGSLGVLEAYLKRWCRGEVGLVDRVSFLLVFFSQFLESFNWMGGLLMVLKFAAAADRDDSSSGIIVRIGSAQ